jgi:hypothetical protein
MSGTVWEPGRQMGTQEGAPSDLDDETHEPNQFYDQDEAAVDRQGTADGLQHIVARVRQALGEARANTERAVVDRLIADVEVLLASVEVTGMSDEAASPTATAPADLEQ